MILAFHKKYYFSNITSYENILYCHIPNFLLQFETISYPNQLSILSYWTCTLLYQYHSNTNCVTFYKSVHRVFTSTRRNTYSYKNLNSVPRELATNLTQYLLQQQLAVRTETRDQVLGQPEERAEHIQRQVIPGRPLQHKADDEETPVLDHVLLHGLRGLHQFADEPEQLRTEGGIALRVRRPAAFVG